MHSSIDNQIASLASQHHASEYNRAKFGQNGCPIPYVPLSLHFPDQFGHLRQRQLLSTHPSPWWPSLPGPSSTDIPAQLVAAMDDQLPALPNHPHTVKTSLSHPINISPIVPPDRLALVSSHAMLFSPASNNPTLLDIASPFTLHRLADAPPPPAHPQPIHSSPPQTPVRTRAAISDALQAAFSSDLDPVRLPINIASDAAVSVSLSVHIPPSPKLVPSSRAPSPAADDWASLSILAPCNPRSPPVMMLPPPSDPPSPSFVLGNLFLSSCPGKKVRLDGPVKGRSAVCRDLETDFRRMKSMGTGCVVCCLDDGELDFLGAPWSEYETTAKHSGIDVLRLPMPEGLPPLTPLHLDGYLVDLITRYTLRGVPVLVHCRGGVGRAGVVACCWLIRLGLCGWIEELRPGEDDAQAVLAFVHRVITYVRRRRSIKAIETYEQVRFLVDYVLYLRNPPPFSL